MYVLFNMLFNMLLKTELMLTVVVIPRRVGRRTPDAAASRLRGILLLLLLLLLLSVLPLVDKYVLIIITIINGAGVPAWKGVP